MSPNISPVVANQDLAHSLEQRTMPHLTPGGFNRFEEVTVITYAEGLGLLLSEFYLPSYITVSVEWHSSSFVELPNWVSSGMRCKLS